MLRVFCSTPGPVSTQRWRPIRRGADSPLRIGAPHRPAKRQGSYAKLFPVVVHWHGPTSGSQCSRTPAAIPGRTVTAIAKGAHRTHRADRKCHKRKVTLLGEIRDRASYSPHRGSQAEWKKKCMTRLSATERMPDSMSNQVLGVQSQPATRSGDCLSMTTDPQKLAPSTEEQQHQNF